MCGATDDRWERVQRGFLEKVAQAVRAGAVGGEPLERVLERLLIEACAAEGATVDELAPVLERDPVLRGKLEREVGRLIAEATLSGSHREALKRQVARHLFLLRFALGGAEPAEWVWEGIDPAEQARIRARRGGTAEDPSTLGRVEEALSRWNEQPDRFGRCEDCGEEIARPRFELLPYADRCVPCQRKKEGEPPVRRPAAPVIRF